MAMREELQKRILDLVIDGAGLYVGKKAIEYLRQYTVKYFKEYNDGAVKILLSLADVVFPQVRTVPYLGDWLSLWGRDGVKDVLSIVIDKPAVCYAEDASHIKCKNFDVIDVAVKINGKALTKDTDYSISGTADEFTITLKTALTPGAHDLLVSGNTKAFAGKIYV
jgi:hypothetical protein